LGIFATIFGRSSTALRPVRSVGEEGGFVDLDLPLAKFSWDDASPARAIARGTFEKRVLSFAVDVHPEWKAQPLEGGGGTFYWGRVMLRSLGSESDAFVALLARLYAQPTVARSMVKELTAEAVGLNSDPRQMKMLPVSMKLFFSSEVQERYAEVYLNIDVAAKLVQFREKDPEYRQNVVQALSESA